jgi:hypothetical protein
MHDKEVPVTAYSCFKTKIGDNQGRKPCVNKILALAASISILMLLSCYPKILENQDHLLQA